MSKKYCIKWNKLLGIIVGCIGVGFLLSIIIPFWGWIILIGIGLIGIGWYLIDNC